MGPGQFTTAQGGSLCRTRLVLPSSVKMVKELQPFCSALIICFPSLMFWALDTCMHLRAICRHVGMSGTIRHTATGVERKGQEGARGFGLSGAGISLE